jgi:hypothetical protein
MSVSNRKTVNMSLCLQLNNLPAGTANTIACTLVSILHTAAHGYRHTYIPADYCRK